MIVKFARTAAALMATLSCNPSMAADSPDKPVRFIVPYTPGGPTDVTARVVGERMAAGFAQPVVIENRPGAGSRIGMTALFRSAPDGYTIGLGTSSITTAPFSQADLPWKPTDFAAISMVVDVPLLIVANPSLPARTIEEILAAAKKEPGRLNGTITHLGFEWLKQQKGVSITNVPYSGATESIRDVVGGRVNMTYDGISGLLPFINDGKLRPVAVSSARRIALLPNVPTLIESGLPDFDVSAWFGIVGPPGTPSEAVRKLNAEIVKAIREPEVRQRFLNLGMEPVGSSPEELGSTISRYYTRWVDLMKSSNIKMD